jgi:hypothetical protein
VVCWKSKILPLKPSFLTGISIVAFDYQRVVPNQNFQTSAAPEGYAPGAPWRPRVAWKRVEQTPNNNNKEQHIYPLVIKRGWLGGIIYRPV